jgi:hypothetical protein
MYAFYNVICIFKKKVIVMKDGERVYLHASQKSYKFSVKHNFFYNNSINLTDNLMIVFHAVIQHNLENKIICCALFLGMLKYACH